MRTFKDGKGREWTVHVGVLSVERVRAATDVNILAVVENELAVMTRLQSEPLLLFRVLYTLCKAQLDAAKVSDEDFSDALVGPPLGAGFDALIGAIADFFPDPQRGQAIRELAAKASEVGGLAMGIALEKVRAIDTGAVLTKLSAGSGSSPAPSASTPAT